MQRGVRGLAGVWPNAPWRALQAREALSAWGVLFCTAAFATICLNKPRRDR